MHPAVKAGAIEKSLTLSTWIHWLHENRLFESEILTQHSIAQMSKALNVKALVLIMFHWVNRLRDKTGSKSLLLIGLILREAAIHLF